MSAGETTRESDREGGATSSASDLCRSCGFCCDGLLYNWVPLEAGEAKRIHLDVIDESAQLAQPCEHLRGTVCGVYDVRPSACSRYRCKLLMKLDDGEVSLDDARARIAKVRRLIEQVERELPDGRGSVWERITRADPEGAIRRRAGADVPAWVFSAGALRGRVTQDFANPWIAVDVEPG